MRPYPDVPSDAPWDVARVHYPANAYEHPPTGLLQVRVVRRGSSYAEIDLGAGPKRVFTRPGDLLVSLPDTPTSFRIAEARDLILLQVKPAAAASLIAAAGGASLEDLRPLTRRPLREPLVAELLRRLEAETFRSADSRAWAVGLIVAGLIGAGRRLADENARRVLSYAKLRELLARVESNLAAPWSVAALAEAAGLTRRAFATAFKEATGLPVHQYLLRLRADRAAALLEDTDLPIAEIALRSGFANQAHLTRVVSKLLGASPKRIREGGVEDR